MRDMIGYCGLDCEKCDAYLATINDDQALREKTAKLWAELNNAPILPENINCLGCRAEGVKTVFCDSICGIRQCALKRVVEVCGGCWDMDGVSRSCGHTPGKVAGQRATVKAEMKGFAPGLDRRTPPR